VVTFSVLEQLAGRKPPLAESLARGWSKVGPLFAAAFLAGIMIISGAVLFVIPGIFLAVRWAVLSPVVVAEGGEDPAERSAQLTAGHGWAIFGVMVLGVVSTITLQAVARLFLLRVLPLAVLGGLKSWIHVTVRLVADIIPDALTLSFSAVLYSVIYYQLRSEKEGIDIEQLTSVFR